MAKWLRSDTLGRVHRQGFLGYVMLPFWNHILVFIYVEIAKIAATWKVAKLAKKIYLGGDLNQGPISRLQLSLSIHSPPRPFVVSGHFVYIPNKDWIHMNSYVWIHIMNSYFVMYEFISGGAMCELPPSHINAAYNSCPDQLGCVRLPRPVRVRVRSAAPIS